MEFLMRKNLAALVVAATIPAAEAADYKIDESRSLAEVNALELKPGDRVLFRRGGVWRGQLVPKSGEKGRPIVYGAYGEGAKPVIEPSHAKNAETDWRDAGNGLWRAETGAKADIGNVVFDHGAAGCAFKRDKLEDVKGELDFWCDPETRAVLIRSDRNPARTFASIELCEKVHAVQSSGGHDIEIDGLWIRYSAAHGVGVSNVARFNVRNCDISWIGGGIQYRDDHGNGVRFGNGVEFWADAEDCTVERNRLWEIWDAALSNQSGGGSHVQKGIRWLGNEVWNSEYSFEYWQSSETSVTDDIVVRDNVFRDAGSGWGHRQRWNPNAAHLMFYDNCAKMTGGFVIENNVFSRSKDTLMRLFNDWRASMTFRGNRWHSDGEPLCRYHGRPVKGLKYRYPMRLDRNHDDSRAEIEEQGFGARVFSADESEDFEKFLSDKSFSSVVSRIIPAPRKCAFGTGFRTYGEKGVPRSQIVFSTDAALPAEGYRLTVGTNGVEIVSADDAGAFYAMQTLRQVEERRGKETRVPYVRIEDWPAFRWRGMHFDDCRHFFGRETLMKTLDVMAQYKYNVLCWHLTEDQGWRLEIPGRPELVKYGSVRSGLPKHRAWTRIKGEVRTMDMNGMRYGPFYYTEKDVREILAYAAERHIMIVPEIEMPGHIKAALAAYPQYACFPENLASREPRTVWGIEKDVLCLGNPEALAFVDEVLAYVAKIFGSSCMTVGGCSPHKFA